MNPDNGLDRYFAATDQSPPQGDQIGVSYRTARVPNENTTPPGGFAPCGDNGVVTINKGQQAHPIWSDTRNGDPFPANGVTHDEDIFTDSVGLPNGKAKTGTGTIGKR